MLPKPACRNFLVQRILKKIDRDKNKSLLDLGFGKGELLNELDRKGYNIKGMEISKQAYDYVKEEYPNLKIYFGYEKLNEKFDVVFSISLLEHIKNDLKVLKDWKNLIKKNGYLIVAVPSKPELLDYWDEFYGHYRRYNKKGLTKLLKKAGYEIISFYSYGFPIVNLADKFKRKQVRKKEMKKNIQERTDASGIMERGGKLTNLLINKFTLFPFLYLQLLFLNSDKSTGYLVLCGR